MSSQSIIVAIGVVCEHKVSLDLSSSPPGWFWQLVISSCSSSPEELTGLLKGAAGTGLRWNITSVMWTACLPVYLPACLPAPCKYSPKDCTRRIPPRLWNKEAVTGGHSAPADPVVVPASAPRAPTPVTLLLLLCSTSSSRSEWRGQGQWDAS
ncbi:hypothetical protein AMECASPLE_004267 [Ameca splendens]|uniref:Uncharacterized protein n=1 Tax=Ameca splendens TaxID=208324 RepID=A0ABV1A6E4_9TELE